MTIGERVVALRAARGWTQGQLQVQTVRYTPQGEPLSRPTISRIEHDERSPETWVVIALAQALETTTDYLLGLTDDPVPVRPLDEDIPAVHPVPDLLPLVQRLNALPTERRKKVIAVVEATLALLD